MYPGWKWLTVDCSLFTAYCKAKGLERRVAGMWEVTPSECEIVNERDDNQRDPEGQGAYSEGRVENRLSSAGY